MQNGIPENRDGQPPSVVAPLDRGVAGLSSLRRPFGRAMLGTSCECHKVREFALGPMGDFLLVLDQPYPIERLDDQD